MGKTAIAIKLEQKRYDHCPNYGPVCFFLFVFVSIYDSIFAFDRVWSCRQLEIKVWELSPRARGGLLTITVLKNCYVFLSFWVPFNYFPFPQNANNFLLQENKRRAEEERARRQAREQREKEINEKRHAEVINQALFRLWVHVAKWLTIWVWL